MVANEEAEKMQWVRLDDLSPWARNARQHSDDSTGKLAAGIRRFGFLVPLTAWRDESRIAAGHGRRLAMLSILREDPAFIPRNAPPGVGPGMVPVMWEDFETEAQFEAFAIADNRQAKNAEDDSVALATILHEMDMQGLGFDGMGFDDGEIDGLIDALEEDGGEEPSDGDDDVPEVAEGAPDSQAGEVYELGPHRLMCGDSTDDSAWAAIGGASDGACMVTDPPYGMAYKGARFGKDGLANDGEGEFEAVMAGAMLNAARVLGDGLAAVFFGASRLDSYFRAVGACMNFHRILTVYKPNGMAKPWRGWILTSEVCGLWSTGKPTWPEAANHCHDVYTFNYSERPDKSVNHPTVKPLSIVKDLVVKLSGPGAVVFDPFAGSGTTLIAAAASGRTARLIELEPKFCDVIRRRWTRWAREHDRDPGPGALEPVTG